MTEDVNVNPWRIMFVCTGNTCRSPMAAALFAHLADQQQLRVIVRSAGINAVPGQMAATHSIAYLAERGIDLSAHRSRPVTPEDIVWADWVLTMTDNHCSTLQSRYPQWSAKITTLGEFVEQPQTIDDPYGGDQSAYGRVYEQLTRILLRIVERLKATQRRSEPS